MSSKSVSFLLILFQRTFGTSQGRPLCVESPLEPHQVALGANEFTLLDSTQRGAKSWLSVRASTYEKDRGQKQLEYRKMYARVSLRNGRVQWRDSAKTGNSYR